MARRGNKGKRTHKPMIGEIADPLGLGRLVQLYTEWLRVRNYSEMTLRDRDSNLRMLIAWLDERGIRKANEVTKPILERYQKHLFYQRKPDGRPLSFTNQMKKLIAAKDLFKWLTRQNYLLYNPASEIELPRGEKRLPRNVLTVSEAEAIVNGANASDPIGVRDRAILETLYSTGMRRMELISLSIYDVYREAGTVMIRLGKGKKDRVVPIGERALSWIDKYLHEARPGLVAGHDEGRLFLTIDGDAFTGDHLSGLVTRYIDRAGIGKKGSCHLFRHTMATLMLEAGADIRFIQQMLGHASLETTQIYTRVSIRQLKEIHTATHPARLERRGEAGTDAEERGSRGAEEIRQTELGIRHSAESISLAARAAVLKDHADSDTPTNDHDKLFSLAAEASLSEHSANHEPTAEELLLSLAAEAAEEQEQLVLKP
jgi:integrase/recombinase XerD